MRLFLRSKVPPPIQTNVRNDKETSNEENNQKQISQSLKTDANKNATKELEKKAVSEKTIADTAQSEKKQASQQAADPKKDEAKTEESATAKQAETQTFEVKKEAKAISEKGLSESKAEKENKYTDLTANKETISSGESVTLDFNTNEAKAGDIYEIIIPEITADGFDATKEDGSGIDSIDFGDFQNHGVGEASSKYDTEKHAWVITDTFHQVNANDQLILLKTSSSFDNHKVHSTGTFDRTITLKKNGDVIKTITFKQKVTSNPSLHWNSSYPWNYDHAVKTMDGNDVKNHTLLANKNYEWDLDIDFDPSFNHGATIDVPMPDNFVLDADATNQNKDNQTLINEYGIKFAQDGKNVKITLPKATNEQLTKLHKDKNYKSSPYPRLIGQFKMDQPDHNVTLTASDKSTLNIKTSETDEHTNTIDPVVVTILGKDHGLDDMPVGNVLTANIDPDTYDYDQDGEPDHKKPVTPLKDKDGHEMEKHDINKHINVSNVTPYDLDNVTVSIDTPDGTDITGLSVPYRGKKFNYTFTFEDGTTQTGSYDSTSGTTLESESGKKIKNIKLTFDKLLAFDSIGHFGLNGVLAKEFSQGDRAGRKVEAGQNIHTDFYVSADGIMDPAKPGHYTDNQKVIDQGPIKPEIHYNQIDASGQQDKNKPADVNAGDIWSYTYDLFNKSDEKLTYYVVLPTNAVLDSPDKITNLPEGAKVNQFNANGRTVVKIEGDFSHLDQGDWKKQWDMKLNNARIITRDNLASNWKVYVKLPEGEKLGTRGSSYSPITDSSSLPFVENATNAYQIGSGDWSVLAALTTYPTSLAKGNKDDELVGNGQSDDKGSWNMTFSNTLVNPEDKVNHNAVIVSHLPAADDGKSEFEFKLKGDNSVQVINYKTRDVITTGVENYYSTENIDLTTLKPNDSRLSDFVAGDQVKDWSKVKMVLTKIAKIPKTTTYSVNLSGYDPTFAKDVNKTGYPSFIAWSDLLNPLVINVNDKDSASIKITGQSTIHVKLHYEDNSAADISVPAADKTYVDGTDTVKQSDFIAADAKNSDYDDAVKNGDYTKIPKAIIDAIPKGYVLDVESGYKIENTNTKYPNDMPNGTAEFGKTSMYYFDGDTVVYNLVKKVDFTKKVLVKRDVKYLDANDGHAVKAEDKTEFTPVTVSGKYNPLTGKVTDISDFSGLDKQSLPSVTPDAKIGGYMLDTVDSSHAVRPVQGETLTKTVKELLGTLDLTKNSRAGAIFSLNEDGQVISHGLTAKNTIEFDQNVVYYYNPSHANLIVLGQSLGEENKLLDSSSSVNADHKENKNIDFKYNDDDLNRDGYTYKIYYFGDESLSSLTPNSETEDAVHNINQTYFENTVISSFSGEEYDTLAGALSAHPQYDDIADGKNDVPDTYTQNFFVVYTPVEQRKQTLYILSDNDPYAENSVTKPFALPKTTEDADASGTDYFKVQGETGNTLLPNTSDGNQAFNSMNASNNYANVPYDPNTGEPIKHNPSVPEGDQIGLGMLSVYGRNGYYIDTATYQVTDKQGKVHTIKIKDNMNPHFDPSSGFYGDTNMFAILNYLTSGNNDSNNELSLTQEGTDKDNSDFEISIDGLDVKPYIDDSGALKIKIPADQTWAFDSTDYDNADGKNVDPAPQILKLHYAAFPIAQGSASIKIHYIDVDGVDPLTPDQIENIKNNNGIELAPSTNKYSYSYQGEGTELQLNADGTAIIEGSDNPITINIERADQDVDNTAKDDQIVTLLKKQSYVVVQRDKQTRGNHKFDLYADDVSNHSYDGNSNGSGYMYSPGYFSVEQNYYVYVKKAHKINYQVAVEDENGNVEKKLVEPTELGIGGTNEDVATSPVNGNGSSADDKQPIGDKYQGIIHNYLDLPNYDLVPNDSTDPKLKKTDTLDGMKFTGDDPQLVTIYLTHKKGNVHVHYIDVDGKTPDAEGNFKPSDGSEIDHTQQDLTDKNYGEEYSNKLWDYEGNNYVLATTTVPTDATSGTITGPDKDVYVYLKHHHTDLNTTKKITEIIHYQTEDGDQVAPDYTKAAPVVFTNKGYHDDITNTDHDNWTTENATFAAVSLPSKLNDGYGHYIADRVTGDEKGKFTGDKKSVAPVKVTVGQQDGQVDITVIYKAPEKAGYKIHYIDLGVDPKKTTNLQPGDGTELTTHQVGVNGDVGYVTDATNKLWNYDLAKYELVSAPKDLAKVKIEKGVKDQYVYLKHRTAPDTQTVSVKEHIDYRYEGEDTGSSASSPVDQTVQYSRTRAKDLVDGSYGDWSDWKKVDDSQFEDKTSPDITNYKPDKESIAAPTTDEISKRLASYDPKSGKDIEFNHVVYYSHKQGTVTVHYIDVNDAITKDPKKTSFTKDDGTEIDSYKQDLGKINYGEDYNNVLKDFGKDHYLLATTEVDPATKSGKVNSPSKDVYVFLKHEVETQTQHATAHENIKYQYEDGKQAFGDYNRSVNYSRTRQHDLVDSKNDSKWTNWTSDKNQTDFEDVDSPTIAGYTPDYTVINKPNVKNTDLEKDKTKNYNYVVTYKADAQKAKLRFYDDTEGKFIDVAPDMSVDGKTNGDINFDPKYDFSKYDFVGVTKTNDPKSTDKLTGDKLSEVQYGKFDNDDKNDQIFIAHFTHKTVPIHETVTINETIHYVYEDGTKAHDDYKATPLTFTKTGTKDLVTGEETVTWSDPQTFAKVESPEIPGYTPDIAIVEEVEVSHGDGDIEKTVTYSEVVIPPSDEHHDSNEKKPEVPEKPEKPEEPTSSDEQSTPKKEHKVKKTKKTKKNKKDKVTKKHSTNSNKITNNSNKITKTKSKKKTTKSSWMNNRGPKSEWSRNHGPRGEWMSNNGPKTEFNSVNETINNKPKASDEELPQTGEKDNKLGILGLLSVSLASLFGFGEKKEKEG